MRASFRKLREGVNDNDVTDCENDKGNADKEKRSRGGDHSEIKSRSAIVKFAVKRAFKVFGALFLIGKSIFCYFKILFLIIIVI